MSGGSGGVWLVCSGVCLLSGGCLGGIWGVSWRCQGCLMVSGGCQCLDGILDTFLDPGTLGPPGTYRNPGPRV